MKTIMRSFLSVLMFPAVSSAQPVITTNEFYYVGDVIQMVSCDATGVSAGGSGAGVVWDFSGLSVTGDVTTTTVAEDTSSVFLTSNLLLTLPGGNKQYVQENSSDSYLNGMSDSVSGVVTYYANYDISKRPFTYLTNYVDTYQVSIPTPSTNGIGYLTVKGDAYGTLTLPTGVYNNVLRIKKAQTELDSISSSSVYVTVTTSYLWFDDVHHPPLLRIDSVVGETGSSNTVMYLATPTGITNINSAQYNYDCYMHNSELLVTGNFVYGKTYDVVVYNIIGAKIYHNEFIADGGSRRFDMGQQVIPGIYIVGITCKDDPSINKMIKVVNQ